MINPLLKIVCSTFCFSLLVSVTTLAIEPSPRTGGGPGVATATPSATPTPKPLPPGAVDEKLFSGMKWRQVGPFRGGRALAIEGVVDEPDTYYFGAVAGGDWETNDYGANWTTVFDKAPISSTSPIPVAPTDHHAV